MHASQFHAVQKAAEKLCQTTFQFLLSCHKAGAIGLLCKLLNSHCQQPLQVFCATLISVTHPCCLRYVIDDPLLLQSSCVGAAEVPIKITLPHSHIGLTKDL